MFWKSITAGITSPLMMMRSSGSRPRRTILRPPGWLGPGRGAGKVKAEEWVPYSPATGLPIESQTVSQMVDRILAYEEGTRLYILAPMIALVPAFAAKNAWR